MDTNSQIAFNPQGKTVVVAAAAQANAAAATAGIPLVAGAVEVLRFPAGWYFSGVAGAADC